jgi:ATP-dependent Clp protease ATP-binding subunit ClpB
MERLSLKSDAEEGADSAVNDRLRKLEEEMNGLKYQSDDLTMKWEAERGGVDRLQELKESISRVRLEIDKAERDYNLNEAAELKFATLPKLEEELEKLEAASENAPDTESGEKMLRDEVTAGK